MVTYMSKYFTLFIFLFFSWKTCANVDNVKDILTHLRTRTLLFLYTWIVRTFSDAELFPPFYYSPRSQNSAHKWSRECSTHVHVVLSSVFLHRFDGNSYIQLCHGCHCALLQLANHNCDHTARPHPKWAWSIFSLGLLDANTLGCECRNKTTLKTARNLMFVLSFLFLLMQICWILLRVILQKHVSAHCVSASK